MRAVRPGSWLLGASMSDAMFMRGDSPQGRPGGGPEELALPLIAELEPVVHPRSRPSVLGRDVVGEEPHQPIDVVYLLHERRFAADIGAQRRRQRQIAGDEEVLLG